MMGRKSTLRSGLATIARRYDTPTIRRYLLATLYAAGVVVVVLRTVFLRDGILHISDLSYLASRKQFGGFYMWDSLAQKQVITNHLLFDPWLAFFDAVVAQRISLAVLFFLLPFVSFVGFRGLLDRHFDRYVTASALLGSLLYTFNPIVVVRSRHYFLVWYYAFLPILFLYAVEMSADRRSAGRGARSTHSMVALDASSGRGAPDATWVKTAVVLFLMSGSVRMPFYFLVPLFVVLGFASAPYGRYFWKQGRRWVAIFSLYVALTAVWSFPYLMRTIDGSSPTPAGDRYLVTEHVLSLLSRNADLFNVLLLRAYWVNRFYERIFGMESAAVVTAWELSVLSIVGVTILGAVRYRRKREVVALSSLLVVTVFLAKGTNPPFPGFYRWLVFDSPLSPIGWQFRGSNKWNLLVMFCYATLASFAVSWLLRATSSAAGGPNRGRRAVVAVTAVGLVLGGVFVTAGFPLLSGHIANDATFVTPSPTYTSLIDDGDEYKTHTYPLSNRRLPTGTPGRRGTSYRQYYQYAMTERADTGRYLGHANVGSVYVTNYPRGEPTRGIDPNSVLTVSRPREMIAVHDRPTYSFTFPYLRERPTVYGTYGIDDRTERFLRHADRIVVNDRSPVPFLSEAIVLAPMDYTRNHDPSTDWAKASTDDPIHGRWHPYLERLEIRNWQFDYDRGLVFTTGYGPRWTDKPASAGSPSLAVPVSVEETTEYKLFVRHLESERGGTMTVSLDDRRRRVDTRGSTNRFVWTDLGSYRLGAGRHELRLTNGNGLNAVNLLVLLPADEYRDQQQRLERLLRNRTVVYAFEAEEGFDASGGASLDDSTMQGMLSLEPGEVVERRIEIDRPGHYALSIRGAGAVDVRLGTERFGFRRPELSTESVGTVRLERGHYRLAIERAAPAPVNAGLDPDLDDGQFSESAPMPAGWTVTTHDFETRADWSVGSSTFSVGRSTMGSRGNSSLAVSTSAPHRQWSWVHTESVDVVPGRRYIVSGTVKYQNVRETHALLFGYNTTTEEWQRLVAVVPRTSGTSGWRTERAILEIPRGITRIKFALNGGWVRDPVLGNATTWFDEFTVTGIDGTRIDVVRLSATPRDDPGRATSDETGTRLERVERISPTKYRVRVNATGPYLLSFAEGYDPFWVADVRPAGATKTSYAPVPLYASTNGFWIDETGEQTVVVRYRPQRWFSQGAAISGLALLASLGYLLYGWRRGNGVGRGRGRLRR